MFQVSVFVSWIALDWNAKELVIKLQFCIVSLHHQYHDLWRTTVNFYLHILVSTKSYDPGGTYLFKVNNGPSRTTYEICTKLTIKTPEQRHWCRSGVLIVNPEQIPIAAAEHPRIPQNTVHQFCSRYGGSLFPIKDRSAIAGIVCNMQTNFHVL